MNIDQFAMYYVSIIWLDKLYKLMKSFFFQISESFLNLL